LSTIAIALLAVTTLVLVGTTVWRLGRPIDAAVLIPIPWLALIAVQALLFGSARGYSGAPRDQFYIATAIGNVAMIGLQFYLDSKYHARLAGAVKQRFNPPVEVTPTDWSRLAEYWWYGIAAIAVGLALLHLWLMPKVPLFELLAGNSDFNQLAVDRENAAKLLNAPSLLKYAFNWDSSIILPILFAGAVLQRWRWRAVLIGIFGLIYVAAPLDKFPSLILVFSAFVAVAVRDRKRAFSVILIGGFLVSLIPAYLISESNQISIAIHHAVGAPLAPQPPPVSVSTTPTPASGDFSVTSILGVKLPGPVGSFFSLVLRRIGSVPADVTYQWFSFFPAVHPFLYGAGWEPWNVLSGHYQNPANMVGLWAYYGHPGYRLTSLSAYSGFTADGWAEFGYLGVLIACLWLFAFAVVIELMRVFVDKPFCLACYAPCLLVVAASAPISGIMAMTFSLGLALGPILCAGYLISGRFLRSGRATAPARVPTTA
jgi:hypothetical protein